MPLAHSTPWPYAAVEPGWRQSHPVGTYSEAQIATLAQVFPATIYFDTRESA